MAVRVLLNMERALAFDPHEHERATAYLEASLQLHDALDDYTGRLYLRLHLGLLAMGAGQCAVALEHYQTALRLAWAAKNHVMLAYCFDALGGAAAMNGAASQAVQLFSVAEMLRARLGAYRTAQEEALYQQWLGATRAQLDGATFERCWSEGRAIVLEQAVRAGLTLALAATQTLNGHSWLALRPPPLKSGSAQLSHPRHGSWSSPAARC